MDDSIDLSLVQGSPPISHSRMHAMTGSGDDAPLANEIDACQELVQLVREIVDASPEIAPHAFLHLLAQRAAGIHSGMLGVFDLARGGANPLPGRGFRPEYDDGSLGQVRHFVGVSLATSMLGSHVTTWLAEHFLRDEPESADGRLSSVAVEFAEALTQETLSLADAATWISNRLCG